MSDTREHRKFVYGFCREALKRSATTAQVNYALELVSPLSGHKALGFKVRLQKKVDGESIKWADF
jgi:hypothetical protein